MWKFNTSTDTLVTADSATQTRGLNRSVQYLKSMEGILRVVTVVCRSVKEEQLAFLPFCGMQLSLCQNWLFSIFSLLAIIVLSALPACSLARWSLFTSIIVASAWGTLLIFYLLRVPHMATFIPWYS